MRSLNALPDEVAGLIASFLELNDIVTLCGASDSHATALDQFSPAQDVIEAYVLASPLCLRSDRRRRRRDNSSQRVPRYRRTSEQCSSSIERQSCPYHNECLRRLLLRSVTYKHLVARKLDATEALQHLHHDQDAELVALDILQWQHQCRRLNQQSRAKTLAHALRNSYHYVVEWILAQPFTSVPKRWRAEVLVALCEYTGDLDAEVLDSLLHVCCQTDGDQALLLIAASANGRLDYVRRVLTDVQVSIDSGDVLKALVAASRGGYTVIVDLLVLHLSALKSPRISLIHVLREACSHGHATVVSQLLASSLFESAPASALHAATIGGDLNILSLVLQDCRFNGWDPLALHQAAKDGKPGVVKLLLQHADCRRCDVEAALRSAVRCSGSPSSDRTTVVRLLIEALPLDTSGSWELVDLLCAHGDVGVLRGTLDQLPTDSWDDRHHWRPTVSAARHGHASIVSVLLTTDATHSSPSAQDDTELAEALLASCHGDHLATTQVLLPHVSKDWMRLLRVVEAAAAAPTSTVLQSFLASDNAAVLDGCDLDAALQYACANGRVDAARLLLRDQRVAFADGVAIQFAATCGSIQLVDLLLRDGRVAQGYDLESALVDAAREGHTAVVARLLADSRLRVTCSAALHEAVHHGRHRVVQLLLEAELLWREPTVLQLEEAYEIAARRGHDEVLFLLLNDARVPLPRRGELVLVSALPKRPRDTMWWRFLRRFFRHPRVKPTEELLLDACRCGREDVVDALLRCGRVAVSERLVGEAQLRVRDARDPRTTIRIARIEARLRAGAAALGK